MMDVFEMPHVVAADEIDRLGHVNNLAYMQWMIDAAVAHSDIVGWASDDYLKLGAAWVVRSHEIRYLRAAVADDRLLVRTWVATMRRLSSVRKYEVVRSDNGRKLATAATEWVFVDLDTRLPRRIAPEVAAAFTVVPDETPEDT